MRRFLATFAAIAACSAGLPRSVGARVHIALDRAHWELTGGASVTSDGIALHYGCAWDDEAAHVLGELDRPGLWTIAVDRRPTTCDLGYRIQLNPPGHEYVPMASAEVSEGTGGLAIELDRPRPIELRIYALGRIGCCGVATFDRVEVIRSAP